MSYWFYRALQWLLLSARCRLWALAWFACLCFKHEAAQAIDPLPAVIPERDATAAEIVVEAAHAIEGIADRRERIKMLGRALGFYPDRRADEYQPLKELVERESDHPESPELFEPYRHRLAVALPETAFGLALRIKSPSLRDVCLNEVVKATAKDNLDLASRAVQEIAGPEARLSALGIIAQQRGDFEQVRTYLVACKQLHSRPNSRPEMNGLFAAGLNRFLPEQLDNVVECVSAELQPTDAVEALARLAGVSMLAMHTNYPKDTQTSARILAIAATMAPRCDEPARATEVLLNYGYAKHFPQEAVNLFDRFGQDVNPRTMIETIGKLGAAGLDVSIARAERIAEIKKLDRVATISAVIGGTVDEVGPEVIMKWIRACPPSPLRNETVLAASHWLKKYALFRKEKVRVEDYQGWLDELSREVLAFTGDELRRRGCRAMSSMAEVPGAILSQEIADEYNRLWPTLLPSDRRRDRYSFFKLLTDSTQEKEIATEYEASRFRECAQLVGYSSLAKERKLFWHEKLLADARGIADPKDRALEISLLGGGLLALDPDRSLRLRWESLSISRQYGLQRPDHYEIPPPFPPTTADEALSHVYPSYIRHPGPLPDATWRFAGTLTEESDREAAIEATGRLLVIQKDYQKATGAAYLLKSSSRRARMLIGILIARNAKTHPFAD